MTYLGTCKAPILTPERLENALYHSNDYIHDYATIVEEAKDSGKIPLQLPTNDELSIVAKEIQSLQGEARNIAFHIVWYIRELSLGRHPELQ